MNKFTVDYISDLHIDFYKFDILEYLIMEKNSDILIIAGDLGHNLNQNIEFVKKLAKKYKYVLIVLGNHDYYIKNNFGGIYDTEYNFNSFVEKIELSKKLYNEIENVHCLNGEVVYINGVGFGGADSWYSNDYLKKYFVNNSSREETLKLWNKMLSDSTCILDNNNKIDFFAEIYEKELEKLRKIKGECQVMITHVNPSSLSQHQSPQYVHDEITTFFNFDGENIYKNSSIKYWFFGHTHKKLKYDIDGIIFLCNPLGYPVESCFKYKFLETIEMRFE